MALNIMSYLHDAYKNHYAVPAFDYSSLWDAAAIVKAAEEEKSPVIVMTIARTADLLPVEVQGAFIKALARKASVPVFTHVDHSVLYEQCEKAVIAGYDSVMIDASHCNLEENISKTKAVVDFAHRNGAFVEAEIGRIKGRNIETVFESDEDFLVQTTDAVSLVKATNVDFLAVGVGSAHGFYTEEPKINQERLAEVNARLGIPLVMHGGTGIPVEMMQESIRNGIAKVNVGTDIMVGYAMSMKNYLDTQDKVSIFGGLPESMNAVKEVARTWIRVCMSNGKAIL